MSRRRITNHTDPASAYNSAVQHLESIKITDEKPEKRTTISANEIINQVALTLQKPPRRRRKHRTR